MIVSLMVAFAGMMLLAYAAKRQSEIDMRALWALATAEPTIMKAAVAHEHQDRAPKGLDTAGEIEAVFEYLRARSRGRWEDLEAPPFAPRAKAAPIFRGVLPRLDGAPLAAEYLQTGGDA